jgi:hypothetical protein
MTVGHHAPCCGAKHQPFRARSDLQLCTAHLFRSCHMFRSKKAFLRSLRIKLLWSALHVLVFPLVASLSFKLHQSMNSKNSCEKLLYQSMNSKNSFEKLKDRHNGGTLSLLHLHVLVCRWLYQWSMSFCCFESFRSNA